MLLNKFFDKIKNIKRVKFTLEKKKIVVFDGVSVKDLHYVLKGYSYFVVEDIQHRINEIYFKPLLVLNFFYIFI